MRGKDAGGGPWPVGREAESHGPVFQNAACRESGVVFALDLLEPAADHAPDFVQSMRDEKQLLLADPTAVANEPPEDTQLFQREAVHALAEGEAVAFGQAGGAVERPADQIHEQSINRRTVNGYVHKRID